MFLKAERLSDGANFEFDVVVIGSGAGGIPVARELGLQGNQVLLVETGGHGPSDRCADLSHGEAVDPRHGHLDRYRARAFGGTTKLWGGRCAPFDSLDFESRPWVRNSGWPISDADMLPYYKEAHEYLDLGAWAYTPEQALKTKNFVDLPSFSNRMVWRYSLPTDLGRKYRSEFKRSRQVTVLLGATCTKVLVDDAGERVVGCELATLDGKVFNAAATAFVVAAGGLETPRLLLNSTSSAHPNGLGNNSDNVGRYYVSHLAGTLGPLTWKRGPVQELGLRYEKGEDGVYVRRSLSLTETEQRRRRALNVRFIVSSPSLSNPDHGSAVLSAGFLAKRFLLNKIPPEFDSNFGRDGYVSNRRQHVSNVLRGIPELLKFAPWWVWKRILASRKIPSMEPSVKTSFYLHFDAEQTPQRHSRISLMSEVDCLGVPRIRVDWKVDDGDVESLVDSYVSLCEELAGEGLIESPVFADRELLAQEISTKLGVGSHHIGTTRMADTSVDGVVDAECRVFGVSNLYISSPSVFPTAGVANPVLTTVALALRVAASVRRDMEMIADHV